MITPKRLARYGWVWYSTEPFSEDLDRIMELVGSSLYEWRSENGQVYIRRLDD